MSDRRRARSERLILDAARELLAEVGFSGLTAEGVASRSGVAKTTIYRRYRSKSDLALGVLLDMVGEVSTQPYRRDSRMELVALVDRTAELMGTTILGWVMQGRVAQIAADPSWRRPTASRS